MLPPALALLDVAPPELAAGGLDDDFLSPPLLPHAASTPAVPARPATPAIPFSTDRRLSCAAASVAEGDESVSRMAASIACSNSFPRNPPRAITAKSCAGGMSTLRSSQFDGTFRPSGGSVPVPRDPQARLTRPTQPNR